MRQLDTWDVDRVHASTKGHMLFAAAAAEALNLPGSNHDWAEAGGGPTKPAFGSRTYGKLRWMQEKFTPWVWRRLRGKSSADGRVPKRPDLEPVSAPSAQLTPRVGAGSGILDP
jgi:lysophospholipase L1-like esterase